jgi:RNA polymerase sigma-70 factor (ECF subfamily)
LSALVTCMANAGFLQSALRTIDVGRTWLEDESLKGRIVERKESLAGLSDEVLVERCKARDHEAFTELVDRYKHKVHWLVRRMIGAGDAEDLAQEVFLRAYQALPGFRGDSKFGTWLFRIARNLCLSELRKTGRHGEQLALDDESEERIHHLLPQSGGGLEEQIERHDLSGHVRKLIDRLPVNYRTALTLFYTNEARYDEIAEIMDIPIGTVKTYIRRARLRLRDLLLEEPGLSALLGESAAGLPRGKGERS